MQAFVRAGVGLDTECGRWVQEHGHVLRSGKRCKKKATKGVKVFWELFAGEGNLTLAAKNAGMFVLDPVDIRHGPSHDLTQFSAQEHVFDVILGGHVDYVHMGTPCTVFSRARRGIRNLAKARSRLGVNLPFYVAKLPDCAAS